MIITNQLDSYFVLSAKKIVTHIIGERTYKIVRINSEFIKQGLVKVAPRCQK